MATLTAAISSSVTEFSVSGDVSAARTAQEYRIDDEVIVLREFVRTKAERRGPRNRNRWSVSREQAGTVAASHLIGAEIFALNGAVATGVSLAEPEPFAAPTGGGGVTQVTMVRTTFVCPEGADTTVPFLVELDPEIQRVTPGGVIGGGTWDITGPVEIGVHTNIPWDVTLAALQAIVDAPATSITVFGGPLTAAAFTFWYIGANLGVNVDPLTVDGTNLTGTLPTITPSTIQEGGVRPGFASSVDYIRADWDNEDSVRIPAPGAAWISAAVANEDWPDPSPNLFIEIIGDGADLSTGIVVGRNALDGGDFLIYAGGAAFATTSTHVVQETGDAFIGIHVQHDHTGPLEMEVQVLVVWFPA